MASRHLRRENVKNSMFLLSSTKHRRSGEGPFARSHSAEFIEFFPSMFRRRSAHETIPLCHETIFRFWRRYPETADGYQVPTKRRGRRHETGDSPMRTISFILAFAFILAGPSMAGSSDQGLPGVGTFSYNASPVAPAPQMMIVATN